MPTDTILGRTLLRIVPEGSGKVKEYMEHNILLMTDSYKTGHWRQYPLGTERVYSYFESRGGKWDEVVFFGLQYLIRRHLTGKVVSRRHIQEAANIFATHFGDASLFNREGWEYILNVHEGRLPLEIKAVPEGTVVTSRNVLMTIENTDPQAFWLTNYVETLLSQVWYPCTVATQSREMRKLIKQYLEKTGDIGDLDFKLLDFGYRGSTSHESAGIGGAAHLVNFQGTDTLAAVTLLRDYYVADMAGFSAPGAEHSTIVSWGEESEADAYANMLRCYPTGLVTVVSDSYDIYNACKQIWGIELKEIVMSRSGTLVVRPDSGDPCIVVPTVLEILGDAYGYETNDKGYKVLPPYIRVIQGDAVSYASLDGILRAIVVAGWSIDNVAFGSGGGLLQDVNRDNLKFGFKCSSVRVNGVEREVGKTPMTDLGKASKRGRLALVNADGRWTTVRQSEVDQEDDRLQVVFRDGVCSRHQSLEEIRGRARI